MLRAVAAQRLRPAVSAGGGNRGAPRGSAPPRGAEGSVAFPPPRPCGPLPRGAEVARGRASSSARAAAVLRGVSGGRGGASNRRCRGRTPPLDSTSLPHRGC